VSLLAHLEWAVREALEKELALAPHMAVAESEVGVMDFAARGVAADEQELYSALALDPQLESAKGNLGLIYALRRLVLG